LRFLEGDVKENSTEFFHLPLLARDLIFVEHLGAIMQVVRLRDAKVLQFHQYVIPDNCSSFEDILQIVLYFLVSRPFQCCQLKVWPRLFAQVHSMFLLRWANESIENPLPFLVLNDNPLTQFIIIYMLP
jgi:hypothetical protein